MVKRIPERKKKIVNKLCECFLKYQQIIVVKLDNVSNSQIQNARNALRNSDTPGVMIVGKNTLILKALEWVTNKVKEGDENYEQRKNVGYKPELKALIPVIKLNVGLIFSDDDFQKLREVIESEVVEMVAKAGIIAPCSVDLPKGPTGLDTGKIDLFHKMNIDVKVAKGTIEIQKPFPIITKDEKVTEAAALMCRTLNMTPFRYTLTFKYVFLPSGQIIGEEVINMNDELVLKYFENGVRTLTGLSLGINLPNQLSLPHMFGNAFMGLMALGVASGYEFKQLKTAMNAAANAPVQTQAAAGDEEKEEEEPEEEDAEVSMGAGLFGDDDSSDEEDSDDEE